MKRLFAFNFLLLTITAIMAPAAKAEATLDLNGDGIVTIHERRLDFLSPGGGA